MRTMFYAPVGNEAGGGTEKQLSLSDLDELENNPAIVGNDGAEPPAKPEEVEGLNEDGSLQEGYIKNDAGEIVKATALEDKSEDGDEGDGDSGDEDETDALKFYEQVDQITGEPVEIDFGTIDPLSPEGVALRDRVIREDAARKFEDYLKTSDPHGYAYMLHRRAGGSDKDFKKEDAYALPDEQEFDDNADMQVNILKRDLLDKGVPTEVVDATVAKYIKDNMLHEKSKIAYTNRKKAQEEQMEKIENAHREKERKMAEAVNAITTNIAKEISEDGLDFIIPETKKAGFNQFVKNNLRLDDGKFYVVTELGDNIKEVLGAQYFQFVKGDLKNLIKREAKKQTVQKLRMAINKDNNAGIKGGSGPNRSNEYISLGSL